MDRSPVVTLSARGVSLQEASCGIRCGRDYNVRAARSRLSTSAAGINVNGVIAGSYWDGVINHGFLRDQLGNFTSFDVPGEGQSYGQGTVTTAINDGGSITGFYYDSNNVFHGFVRDSSGNFTTFDAPQVGTRKDQGTMPLSINSQGQISGWYLSSKSVYRGFIRESSGVVTAFIDTSASTLPYEGTLPRSINDSAKITGTYADTSNFGHGFLLNREY